MWRGKEAANDMIHNSAVASYDLLLSYVDKVLQTNSGSVVYVESEEGHLKRVFSFGVSLHSFAHGYHPMFFVDGIHLLGRYGSSLLATTEKDGSDGLFHVAFTIVDNETYNS